jgi:hypothetical protein
MHELSGLGEVGYCFPLNFFEGRIAADARIPSTKKYKPRGAVPDLSSH